MNSLAGVHRLAGGHILGARVDCTCGWSVVGDNYAQAVQLHIEHALAEYAKPIAEKVNA